MLAKWLEVDTSASWEKLKDSITKAVTEKRCMYDIKCVHTYLCNKYMAT